MKKQEIKDALHEVIDESMVNYSQGSAEFAKSVSIAMSDLINAFDKFVVGNLVADPKRQKNCSEKLYVDARTATLKHASEALALKTKEFDGYRSMLRENKRAKIAGKVRK